VKYVLDTNTVSFLMRGEAAVRERLTALPRTDVLLCQPVIAEIEYGLARLRRSARASRLHRLFDVLLEELVRISWTDEVSRAFGRIKADLERRGMRLEDFDVAVAAHAVAAKATLVTDDVGHMRRVAGLRVERWRESRPG